eukprot:TRINITY_DN5679_c1_g1_i1.p2 TRINITY_DN5679_c1_g1~~TRINITY_DN5679_c1_g1_i1.p2  ORF type:complete len:442 (+),score=81.06 TRINITY_DN5679_c1_g1_i1:183-1328(+)
MRRCSLMLLLALANLGALWILGGSFDRAALLRGSFIPIADAALGAGTAEAAAAPVAIGPTLPPPEERAQILQKTRQTIRDAYKECPCLEEPLIHLVIVIDLATKNGTIIAETLLDTYAEQYAAATFVAGARSQWVASPELLQRLGDRVVDAVELGGSVNVQDAKQNWQARDFGKSDEWYRAQARFLVGLSYANRILRHGTRWILIGDSDTLPLPHRVRAVARRIQEFHDPLKTRIRAGAEKFSRKRFGFQSGAGVLISVAAMQAVKWPTVLREQITSALGHIPADWRMQKVFDRVSNSPGHEILFETREPLGMYQRNKNTPGWEALVRDSCAASVHHMRKPEMVWYYYNLVPASPLSDDCIPRPACCPRGAMSSALEAVVR